MEIWIVRDGERSGPYQDFEVRRRINASEWNENTPAWHEGMKEWGTLGEIECFRREFQQESEAEKSPTRDESALEKTSVQPDYSNASGRLHLGRRFWARWFDLYLYEGIWWMAIWAMGADIGAVLDQTWLMIFHFMPWFVLEIVMLQRFGTTPGKWLMGLRVLNRDGSRMNVSESMRRAWRVYFIGIGMGWGLLALICQLMALAGVKRFGMPIWDHAGGHQVIAEPLRGARVGAFVCLWFVVLQMQMLVVSPHVVERVGHLFPALKENYEKNPPRHLPKRN
jgi:uncharacterized RDD family membrane protein YckC